MDRWRAAVERIGARFRDRDRAVATMHELQRRFELDATDVEVRPLGSTRYDQPLPGTLLAGRFPPGEADAAVGLITARGGEIVERRAEPSAAEAGQVVTLAPPERARRIEPPRGSSRATRSWQRSRSP